MAIIHFRRRDTRILFENPKCRVVVPKPDYLLYEAIAQATLDPSVRLISQRAFSDELLKRLSPNGIILGRADGNYLLVVLEQLQRRTGEEDPHLADALRSSSLRLLERTAIDIKEEPVFSNVRKVWSREHYPVSLLDRLKLAAALADNGPQSIAELKARANPACDTLAAACALACADLVELNLHVAIGPNTIVSVRNHDR